MELEIRSNVLGFTRRLVPGGEPLSGMTPGRSRLALRCVSPAHIGFTGGYANAAEDWVHALVHTIDWLVHGLSWHNQSVSQHPPQCANVPVGARLSGR